MIGNGKPGDAFPGEGTSKKWHKVGTDEDTVRPPVDAHRLRIDQFASFNIGGSDNGRLAWSSFTNKAHAGGISPGRCGGDSWEEGSTARVMELTATTCGTAYICCYPDFRSVMCETTWDPLYQSDWVATKRTRQVSGYACMMLTRLDQERHSTNNITV